MKFGAPLLGLMVASALTFSTLPTFAENNMNPPFVETPANAASIMVKVELEAKDPAAFKAYLMSQRVIPVTRTATGINFSWSTQDPANPAKFTLIQKWNSKEQHAAYIQWRVDTGALKELTDQLAVPPVVTYLEAFDTETLPAQVKTNCP
jgi:quinol monooxygenase YgiN